LFRFSEVESKIRRFDNDDDQHPLLVSIADAEIGAQLFHRKCFEDTLQILRQIRRSSAGCWKTRCDALSSETPRETDGLSVPSTVIRPHVRHVELSARTLVGRAAAMRVSRHGPIALRSHFDSQPVWQFFVRMVLVVPNLNECSPASLKRVTVAIVTIATTDFLALTGRKVASFTIEALLKLGLS
jgi:hypothetical protein